MDEILCYIMCFFRYGKKNPKKQNKMEIPSGNDNVGLTNILAVPFSLTVLQKKKKEAKYELNKA